MSPPSMRTHVFQSADVLTKLPAKIVFDRHGRELRGELQHFFITKRAHFGSRVDVETGHDALGHKGTDTIEGFKGALGDV